MAGCHAPYLAGKKKKFLKKVTGSCRVIPARVIEMELGLRSSKSSCRNVASFCSVFPPFMKANRLSGELLSFHEHS